MKFKYSKQKVADTWQLTVTPFPDWQEFEQFCEQFIEQEGAEIISSDYGMDRHQVRFRLNAHQYILQFEHYTESIWVEQDY